MSENSNEPAAPAVGEDEALLNVLDAIETKLASTEQYELAIGCQSVATRLRTALADVARLTWELATEKDYTQSAYLAAREAGEACGKAVDERNEARAAAEAAEKVCEAIWNGPPGKWSIPIRVIDLLDEWRLRARAAKEPR